MSSNVYQDWNQFLFWIHRAIEELGNPEVIWYRGMTNYSYSLIPSLLRFSNGLEKEKDLFEKYQQVAIRFFPDRKADWEDLTDMQHYGLPTRLLDWTEVLGIAIFFSLLRNDEKDSVIYVLDPISLNRESNRERILQLGKEEQFDYKELYWEHRPVPAQHPIAAEMRFQNERIFAQKGKFTIHGRNHFPLEEQFPDYVKKIRLPISAFDGATNFLEMAGINELSVFPDIVGLVPYLIDLVGMDY